MPRRGTVTAAGRHHVHHAAAMSRPAESFPPPATFDAFERRLWAAIVPRLLALGRLEPEYASTLEYFVRCAAIYFEFQRERGELRVELVTKGADPTTAAAQLQEIDREIAEHRKLARQFASDFLLLPAARAGLALVDAAGEDIELRRLFGLESHERDSDRKTGRQANEE